MLKPYMGLINLVIGLHCHQYDYFDKKTRRSNWSIPRPLNTGILVAFMLILSMIRSTVLLHGFDVDWLYNENWLSANLQNYQYK